MIPKWKTEHSVLGNFGRPQLRIRVEGTTLESSKPECIVFGKSNVLRASTPESNNMRSEPSLLEEGCNKIHWGLAHLKDSGCGTDQRSVLGNKTRSGLECEFGVPRKHLNIKPKPTILGTSRRLQIHKQCLLEPTRRHKSLSTISSTHTKAWCLRARHQLSSPTQNKS